MNRKFNIIRKFNSIVLLLMAIVLLSSCEKTTYTPANVDPNATWHFSTDIQPIFIANCITCHGGTRSPDLRSGKSYAALTKGGFVTSPANNSILYKMITGSDHAPRSTDAEKLKILYWIQQGALNN